MRLILYFINCLYILPLLVQSGSSLPGDGSSNQLTYMLQMMHKDTAGEHEASSNSNTKRHVHGTGIQSTRFTDRQRDLRLPGILNRRRVVQHSSRTISLDPVFLDLDEFDNFNDISESNDDNVDFATKPPPFVPVTVEEEVATPFVPVTVEDEILENSFSEFDNHMPGDVKGVGRFGASTSPPVVTSSAVPSSTTTSAPEITSTTPVTIIMPSVTTTTQLPETISTSETPFPTLLPEFSEDLEKLSEVVTTTTQTPTTVSAFSLDSEDYHDFSLSTASIDEMTTRTTVPTASSSSSSLKLDEAKAIDVISSSASEEPPTPIVESTSNIHSIDLHSQASTIKSIDNSGSIPGFKMIDNGVWKGSLPTTTEPSSELWWTPRPAYIGQTAVHAFKPVSQSKPKHVGEAPYQNTRKHLYQWGRTHPFRRRLRKHRVRDNKSIFMGTSSPLVLSVQKNTQIPTMPQAVSSFPIRPDAIQANLGPTKHIVSNNVREKEILNELESLAKKTHLNDLQNVFKDELNNSNLKKKHINDELSSKKNALRQLELLKDLHQTHILNSNSYHSVNNTAQPQDITELDLALRELNLSKPSTNSVEIVQGPYRNGRKGKSKFVKQGGSRYRIHKMTSGLQLVEREIEPRKLMHGFGITGQGIRKLREPKTYMALPRQSPLRYNNLPSTTTLPVSDVNNIKRMIHLLKRSDDSPVTNPCAKALCSFEAGDLCFWESSYDETTKVRAKRAIITENERFYVLRSWSNWFGKYNSSVVSIDNAPIFSSTNLHFAGILLNAQQRGSLALQINHQGPFKLRFRGWDSKAGTILKACCGESCFISNRESSNEQKWKKLQVQCPANTTQVSFECINKGPYVGSCGVDDVSLFSSTCTAAHESE